MESLKEIRITDIEPIKIGSAENKEVRNRLYGPLSLRARGGSGIRRAAAAGHGIPGIEELLKPLGGLLT